MQSALATRLVLHLRKVKSDGETSSSGIQKQTPPVELHDMKSPKAHVGPFIYFVLHIVFIRLVLYPQGDLKSFLPC